MKYRYGSKKRMLVIAACLISHFSIPHCQALSWPNILIRSRKVTRPVVLWYNRSLP